MREILFRAVSKLNGNWVYGSYVKHLETIQDEFQDFDIYIETLGQFIGLKDKNGTKIFEGDIVKCGNSVYVIDFGFHYSIPSDFYDYGRAYGFYFLNENEDEYYSINDETDSDVEVIGNIYDNKELLEEI